MHTFQWIDVSVFFFAQFDSMIELSWGIERGYCRYSGVDMGICWGSGKSGKRWMDGLDPVIRYMML